MAVSHGYSKITTSGSVFAYDTGDTFNSYKGEPTTNFIPSPYDYSLYAYASGPVNTTTTNELGNTITAKRYTITQAINVARAAIFTTSLSTGVAYTFSVKWRYNGITTTTPGLGMDASKGNPEVGGNNSFTSQTTSVVAIGGGWYLSTYTFVFATSPTSACILTFGISTGATAGYVNETFDVYEAQFEVKDHRTQPVIGTRSVSGSVIDIAANTSTMVMTNMTYNNQAYPVFLPASSSRIAIDNNSLVNITGSEITLEQILYKTDTITATPVHKEVQYTLQINGSGGISYADSSLWSYGTFGYHGTSLTPNVYHHLVAVKRADTTVAIYIDGKLIISKTFGGAITSTTNQLIVGAYAGTSQFFSGLIPVTRLYNRALTEGEILDNYNHYKTRFNLP